MISFISVTCTNDIGLTHVFEYRDVTVNLTIIDDQLVKQVLKLNVDEFRDRSSSEQRQRRCRYDALRNEARSQVGDELTVWKDCVGKKELNKKLRKGNGDEEGEEEEEEVDSLMFAVGMVHQRLYRRVPN